MSTTHQSPKVAPQLSDMEKKLLKQIQTHTPAKPSLAKFLTSTTWLLW